MAWTAECDDEYEDLMEEYPQHEPAIERACRFEGPIACAGGSH